MNRQLENIEDENLSECEFCDTEKPKVEHAQICPGCKDDFASMGIEIANLKSAQDNLVVQIVQTNAALTRWITELIERDVPKNELLTVLSETWSRNDTFLKVNGFIEKGKVK